MARYIKVGITHGDINGIGYEVIIKALSDDRMYELFTPVIFGSKKICSSYCKMLGADDFHFNVVDDVADVRDAECNLVDVCGEDFEVIPGKPTEEAGRAAFISLEAATDALLDGTIDVLVTAPINKNTIQGEGFHFSGHTEYLEAKIGNGYKAMMILYNDNLRVGLATTHLPLKDVAASVTKELIIEKVRNLNNTLRKDFAIERPKIAVLALNPHAGDASLLGTEEEEIITPAIEELRDKGIMTFGPFPADGFFGNEKWKAFDGVIAMYHDQGLAPFKALAMENGVNFTAGIPYVRTSPDHGTGYDIAGKGVADESSFRQAIYSAIDLYRNRRIYIRSHSNPLRKQYVDKSGDKEVLDLSAE